MNTKFSNKKKTPFIYYSNNNIFEIARERVTGGNNGCTVFIPHVCNNIDLFGAGFAAQVADKYPSVKADYHMLGKTFLKNNLGYAQVIKVFEDPKYRHKLFFVNMIAQNGVKGLNNPRPLNYLALVKSMNNMVNYIQNHTGFGNGSEKVEIHCPKFGSGLAGGNWNFIEQLIEDVWSKYFVTAYNYNPREKS
jgi:hypothetical protein